LGEHVVKTQLAEQRLLALLALRGAQPRTTIAGLLWPHSAEAHARGSLRSTIWRVRKAIPLALTCKPPYLALDVRVDVDATHLARAAHALTDTSVQNIQVATAEFQLVAQTDELLPGWYDDWVLIERERLYQLRLHALEAHAERLVALRRYADALEAAFTALAAEPYRESPHQLIARIHLAEGNLNEAIRAFQLYHRVVVEELDPGARTRPPRANLADIKRWLARD
jgi:DNA-binding SARP family transcriptional activator